MQIPLNNIIDTIKKQSGLTEEDISAKIKDKMEELSGLVSEEGAAHIVANEMNIKLFIDKPQEIKINEVKPFMKNLCVFGKITNIFDLIEFERNSNPGKVRTCIIGDETGKIRTTFWHDATKILEKAKEGDIIKIEKATSRENNGRSELSVSFEDSATLNPEGISIEVTQKTEDPRIKKIVELDNDTYAAIMGTIVQVFKPNFFYICPECRKRLKEKEGKFSCEEHGEVDKKLGYVMNLYLDDGTEVMRVVLFNEQMDELTEKNEEFFKEHMSDEKAIEDMKQTLIGKILKVVGKIRFNSFSNKKELIANKLIQDIKIDDEM